MSVCVTVDLFTHEGEWPWIARPRHPALDVELRLNCLRNSPTGEISDDAARLIQESYPADLKSRGVGDMVELQFVVDPKGKVDPASVEVVDATQTALGEVAKKVVARLDFSPGKLNGASVKTQVVLPIIYKP